MGLREGEGQKLLMACFYILIGSVGRELLQVGGWVGVWEG